MLIELDEPFKSMWRKGYLVDDGEGRQRVVFYNSEQDRSAMTYARYLMCVKLGYILPTELEVDHKDDDKSNDDINNLQVLTGPQNKAKEMARRQREGLLGGRLDELGLPEEVNGLQCAYCETNFLLDVPEYNKRVKTSKSDLAFCSHRCSTSYFPPSNNGVTQAQIEQIKALRLQGLSSYKISETLGLARNTVMKYWS